MVLLFSVFNFCYHLHDNEYCVCGMGGHICQAVLQSLSLFTLPPLFESLEYDSCHQACPSKPLSAGSSYWSKTYLVIFRKTELFFDNCMNANICYILFELTSTSVTPMPFSAPQTCFCTFLYFCGSLEQTCPWKPGDNDCNYF